MTKKPRHTLPKLALLRYALDGAKTERGLYVGNMSSDDREYLGQLNNDIKEIKRRIKLTEIAAKKKKEQDDD